MKKTKYKFLIGLLFSSCFFIFFIFLNWLSNDPKPYLDDIFLNFKGKIVNKYYKKAIHIVIKIDNKEIDISCLSNELIEESSIGDSLVKFEDSNCCILIKKQKRLKLKFIHIPKAVLERSEYLRKVSIESCTQDTSEN